MENKALVKSAAEQNALAVTYEVLGTQVSLDIDFVKNYLVRGKASVVTNQELVLFINTCKMQKLNPLATGEVYLIKYDETTPAQMVVGKDAYTKRAFLNPNYVSKSDGIVVQRGNDIVRKEGCCLYPAEKLIGGWCRITYVRRNQERTAFREVSLTEYDKGKSTWKAMPATMINKVAIAQCIRDAFPAEYEGLYSEDELIASGVITVDKTGYTTVPTEDGTVVDDNGVVVDKDGVVVDPGTNVGGGGDKVVDLNATTIITQEERKALFTLAQQVYGSKEKGNDELQKILASEGIKSTSTMTKEQYIRICEKINGDSNSEGNN